MWRKQGALTMGKRIAVAKELKDWACRASCLIKMGITDKSEKAIFSD
jgi:hypothetical protein